MSLRTFAGLAVMVMLLPGVSRAENPGRIEPLDGIHNRIGPASGSELRRERDPFARQDSRTPPAAVPHSDLPPMRTPFGEPVPPNRLTPAPVLPFNPNRPLMPPAASPGPSSGGGHVGR